jgi:hypothetical protein
MEQADPITLGDLLRRLREQLEESAARGALSAHQEKRNPVAFFAWAGASIVGYTVQWDIPALNSLLCAAVLYYAAMMIVAIVQHQDRVVFTETSTQRFLAQKSRRADSKSRIGKGFRVPYLARYCRVLRSG